jgi:hypothetical protein
VYVPRNRPNMFLALIWTVASVAQYAVAHNHNHEHHNHEEDGNGRLVEGRALRLRGLQSTFEPTSASNEFNKSKTRCGTISPPKTGYDTGELLSQPDLIFRKTVRVAVHWQSIQRDDGSEGATKDQIVRNIRVLNAAYASTGFQFDLKTFNTTKSTIFWSATVDSPAELEMKTLLGVRDCNILNVYSIGPTNDVFGWATFPQYCKELQVNDGVVVDYTTLPGGASIDFNLGDVLVHEVRKRRILSLCYEIDRFRSAAQCMPLTPFTGWPLVCTSCMNLDTPFNEYLTTNLLCRLQVWAASYI